MDQQDTDKSNTRSGSSRMSYDPWERFRNRVSPRIFALIIAIDKYKSEDCRDLSGCKNDGTLFVRYLTTLLRVPPSHVVHLADEQATRQEILKKFDQFLVKNDDIRRDDPIIVYFAGYGSQLEAPIGWLTENDKINILCTHDSWTTGDDGKMIWGISDRAIQALLHTLALEKGNNITAVFDCCFAHGEQQHDLRVRSIPPPPYPPRPDLDREIWSSISKPDARAAQKEDFHANRVLLTACRPDEVAFEDASPQDAPGGLFTAALLAGLWFSDPNNISYAELLGKLDLEHEKQHPRCEGANKDRRVFNVGAS